MDGAIEKSAMRKVFRAPAALPMRTPHQDRASASSRAFCGVFDQTEAFDHINASDFETAPNGG